jgi:hypothetical protein
MNSTATRPGLGQAFSTLRFQDRKELCAFCPSQLDVVRFLQLCQRFSKTVHAGLLIVKLLGRLQLSLLQPDWGT